MVLVLLNQGNHSKTGRLVVSAYFGSLLKKVSENLVVLSPEFVFEDFLHFGEISTNTLYKVLVTKPAMNQTGFELAFLVALN